MLLHKTPSQPKFRHNRLKNAWDIHNQKLVLQKKWAKVHENRLRPATPKTPIMPNFIDIYQASLEKSVTNFFYTRQYFVSPGSRVTSLGDGVHLSPLSSNLENFVLFWRHFSEITAAKVSQFCCLHDKKTKFISDKLMHVTAWQCWTP